MSIRLSIIIFAVLILLTTSTGCSLYFSRFSPPIKQDTNIILKENDFEIIETNLEGEASLSYFLGIPLGDARLYSKALGDLYSKATVEVTDEPTQLINWTVDETTRSFIIFSTSKVKFRADLMKFNK